MDEWEEKAEALLPKSHWADDDVRVYVDDRRPAVAAGLRAAYLKGLEDAKTINESLVHLAASIQSRIDELKAEKK